MVQVYDLRRVADGQVVHLLVGAVLADEQRELFPAGTGLDCATSRLLQPLSSMCAGLRRRLSLGDYRRKLQTGSAG